MYEYLELSGLNVLYNVLVFVPAGFFFTAFGKGKPAKGKIVISDETKAAARERVNKLLGAHVLYPELDLDFLKKEFVK